MTNLGTAKVWDGSAWVAATGGQRAGDEFVFPYSSDFATDSVVSINRANTSVTTANVAAHTFGAWRQHYASTPSDVSMIYVIAQASQSGASSCTVLDIGIGAAGAETSLMHIPVGSHSGYPMLIPIQIPAGSRIATRIQSEIIDGKNVIVQIGLVPTIGGFTSAPTVDVYGVDLATSRGVNVPTQNTWQEITASTTRDYRALSLIWSGGSASQSNGSGAVLAQLGAGAAGSETTISYSRIRTNSSEQIYSDSAMPNLYVGHVPAGTRLSARHGFGVSYFDATIVGVPYR